MKHCRYDDRQDALAYRVAVNGLQGFPLDGRTKDGTPVPDSQTLRWVQSPLDCEDGKTAVPEMTDEFYQALGVSESEKSSIIDTYVTARGATVEDFSSSWLPNFDEFTDIAANGTATASSEVDGNVASNVQDGRPLTFWKGGEDPQWIQVEFAVQRRIAAFAIRVRLAKVFSPVAVGYPRRFLLRGSNDGENFTTLRVLQGEVFAPAEIARYRIPLENRAFYKYYRLVILNSALNSDVAIAALRLYVRNV
jgi:hypothetical protein